MAKKMALCFATGILCIWLGLFPAVSAHRGDVSWAVPQAQTSEQMADDAAKFARTQLPEVIDLASESAVLMDAATGQILYEKNMDKQLYPASITKLMTLLLALENASGHDQITMSYDAVFSVGRDTSHIALDENEQLSMQQACYAAMLPSANDASNGIAETIGGSMQAFAQMMTQRARELGCENTNFVNAHGLHDANHFTTARDMALITKELMKHPAFLTYAGTVSYDMEPTNKQPEVRHFHNQCKLLQPTSTFYYEDAVAAKTGFTNEARHTMVTVATRGDVTLICVVLKSELANDKVRDTIKLFDYGFDHFTVQRLSTDVLLQEFVTEDVMPPEASTVQFLLHDALTLDDVVTDSNIVRQDENGFAVQTMIELGSVTNVMYPQITTVSSRLLFVSKAQQSWFVRAVLIVLWVMLSLIGAFALFVVYRLLRRQYRRRKRRKMQQRKRRHDLDFEIIRRRPE